MKHAVVFNELNWSTISDTLDGFYIIRQIPPIKSFTINCSDADAENLRLNPNVKMVVKVEELSIDIVASYPIPENPIWTSQWELAMIDVPAAHELQAGQDTVVVAVIDTGLSMTHEAFAGKTITGYQISGVDPWDAPVNYHGTQVASCISSAIGTTYGMGSVAPGVTIMPIRVTNTETAAGDDDIAEAINIAVTNGADIINISMSAPGLTPLSELAINDAVSAGVVVVGSAGNTDYHEPMYPASYTNVISVGAVNIDKIKSQASSYGPYVDILAPGEDITVPSNTGGYTTVSGTSFSAPIVSGVAALSLSEHATLSRQELIDIVLDTATPIKNLESWFPAGSKLVNAKLATLAAKSKNGSDQVAITFLERRDVLKPLLHSVEVDQGSSARVDIFGTTTEAACFIQHNQYIYKGPPSKETTNVLFDTVGEIRAET